MNQDTIQLAKDFSDFYLKITAKGMDQIGNYRIVEEIGEGAFGKVYLAMHVLLNIPVVLKSGLIDDPNIVREIYYHKQLKHKNIVKLYEVIKTETRLWLVMEYCQGNELYYYIYEHKRIDVKRCQQLFFQIIQGIKYVHSLNLAHRDLKLENILLADKKKTVVKLTDFGFVREFDPAKRKLLSTVCGTTVYMAPEVLKSEKYSGFLTDIWSLGVILYTMLYGEMPFDEDDDLKTKFKIISDEPDYKETIPQNAIVLLKKMLNKDPNSRPNLNEILNSDFLIDITNKMSAKMKRSSSQQGSSSGLQKTGSMNSSFTNLTDCESIVSISQHYNSGQPPFQSKITKNLLKKMQKCDFKVDELEDDIMNNHMTSLTAFYELCLTKEFQKKKKKYLRDRRRKAKRSLSKSKRKVKSVLSMSEEGQPLERIMSSLSMNSKNQSKYNLPVNRKSSEKRRSILDIDAVNSHETSTPPLNRLVSFYPEADRSVSSMRIPSNQQTTPNKKNKIMNRLQFWKKNEEKEKEKDPRIANSNGTGQNNDEFSDLTLNSPSPKTVDDNFNQIRNENIVNGNNTYDEKQPNSDKLPHHTDEIPNETSSLHQPLISTSLATTAASTPTPPGSASMLNTSPRTESSKMKRPSSMISQISQISHLSQLSTMTESELELSDSMDEFDEDEMYESSITRRTRPGYKRQLSDLSIGSASTSTTNRNTKKPLSQVSSNSSEESDIVSPIPTRVKRPLNISLSTSPVPQHSNSSSPMNISAPVQRSSSPPIPNKFNKDAMKSLYARSIINEENEDDVSL